MNSLLYRKNGRSIIFCKKIFIYNMDYSTLLINCDIALEKILVYFLVKEIFTGVNFKDIFGDKKIVLIIKSFFFHNVQKKKSIILSKKYSHVKITIIGLSKSS